jgi:tRNA pseudouridine38-40 synthase
MQRFKITLQYDGTNYHGWQIQANAVTIQGILEEALRRVTGRSDRITGAARTDAGVHALQQVASFSSPTSLDPRTLMRALNANIPEDIRVISASHAGEDFHPRYSALKKRYTYLITRPGPFSVMIKRYSWQVREDLDTDAMKEAARMMTGRHDFSSFRAAGCSAGNPVRDLDSIEIEQTGHVDFMNFRFHAPLIRISVTARSFLRHMVRNIVGTLVDVGKGSTSADAIKDIIGAKDRSAAGRTAPANGLFLEKIVY